MQTLARGIGFESVQVTALTGIDGQGKPTYAAAVAIKARVVRETALVVMGDGSKVRSVATLWIDVAQPKLPAEQDVLVLDAGVTRVTVIERTERMRVEGALDHIRIRCREGG